MTLEQLRIFVSVAEHLHMTKAAAALHITQSAASAAIASLEKRYDIQLFNRVGRGIELSAAGQLFLSEAKAVLNRAQSAVDTLHEITGLKKGSLRIAASQTVAHYWLPFHLAGFARKHPEIEITLQDSNTREVVRQVMNGETDIGIIEGKADAPSLTRETVGQDCLRLYAAPSHPLAAHETLHLAQLKQAHWILREPGSGTRIAFEDELLRRGLNPQTLTITLTLPSNEGVLAAVTQGHVLTAVSELAAAPLVAMGKLRALGFDMPIRPFTLITHRERPSSPAAQAFRTQCRHSPPESV